MENGSNGNGTNTIEPATEAVVDWTKEWTRAELDQHLRGLDQPDVWAYLVWPVGDEIVVLALNQGTVASYGPVDSVHQTWASMFERVAGLAEAVS